MNRPERTLTECPVGYSQEAWDAVKGFRPDSYWEYSDPLQAILSKISGRARREMITDFWDMGIAAELDEELLKDELTAKVRNDLGRIHPFFMGGEFLPDRLLDEVPIVRIDLQSTTFDVLELRARRLSDGNIALRWVDEYDTEFRQPVETIDRPFSLEELVAFIQGSDNGYPEGTLPLCYTLMNAQEMDDPTELENFTSLSSDFYPELAAWFWGLNEAWLAEVTPEEETEEEEETWQR